MNEQKQQQKLSAEARKVLAGFTALTENEKIQVLNKSGIWYLRHKGALVAPMLEARGILHALARLSWICQRVFLLAFGVERVGTAAFRFLQTGAHGSEHFLMLIFHRGETKKNSSGFRILESLGGFAIELRSIAFDLFGHYENLIGVEHDGHGVSLV